MIGILLFLLTILSLLILSVPALIQAAEPEATHRITVLGEEGATNETIPETIPSMIQDQGSPGSDQDTSDEGRRLTLPAKAVVRKMAYVSRRPDKDAGSVGLLNYGESVVVRDVRDGWATIDYQGSSGYTQSKFLAFTDEVVENDPVAPNETGNVDTPSGNGKLIAIDAGHQRHANNDKEPVGPGSSEMKAKVTSGTSGVATGVDEYEFNLILSKKLRDELEARGYEVLMIREENDVDISNVERAEMANEAGADAFLRIHADSSDDPDTRGCMTICQTGGNPYNANIYEECRRLSRCILNGLVDATEANDRGVYESDTYSGINWARVPVTIIEVGLMSNPDEDRLLQEDWYQKNLVDGIANGLDSYFTE